MVLGSCESVGIPVDSTSRIRVANGSAKEGFMLKNFATVESLNEETLNFTLRRCVKGQDNEVCAFVKAPEPCVRASPIPEYVDLGMA